MLNLQSLGLVELNAKEVMEIEGGEIITNYQGGDGHAFFSFFSGFYSGFISGLHGN